MNISFSNWLVMSLASLQALNVSARLTGTSNGFVTFPTTPDFNNPAPTNQNTVYGDGGYTIKSIFPGNLPFSLSAVNANANGCALAITNSDCPTSLKLNQECHFDVAVLYPNDWDSKSGVINGYIDVECQAQGNYKSYFSVAVDVVPTYQPSLAPTATVTSAEPSMAPSPEPSMEPSAFSSHVPSAAGTVMPTADGSLSPTQTANDSLKPSVAPTAIPSGVDTVMPTLDPSVAPSAADTVMPSVTKTVTPTVSPSVDPSMNPSMNPSALSSRSPSAAGTVMPTVEGSLSPTQPKPDGSVEPSVTPTAVPSGVGTVIPSAAGTVMPTVEGSLSPTQPKPDGSVKPSATPTAAPSGVNTNDGFCHKADFTCIAICVGIPTAIAAVAAVGYAVYLQRQRDAKSGIYQPLNGAAVAKNNACCWSTKPSYINHVG